MECFICFNEILNPQEIFFLKCCNNNIHKNCIKEWHNNINNKKNNLCPYCRKNNIDLNNIENNNIGIIIMDNYDNIHINNNNIQISRPRCCKKFFFNFFFIILIIMLVIFLIIFYHV